MGIPSYFYNLSMGIQSYFYNLSLPLNPKMETKLPKYHQTYLFSLLYI